MNQDRKKMGECVCFWPHFRATKLLMAFIFLGPASASNTF